jgi:hypothetical protein
MALRAASYARFDKHVPRGVSSGMPGRGAPSKALHLTNNQVLTHFYSLSRIEATLNQECSHQRSAILPVDRTATYQRSRGLSAGLAPRGASHADRRVSSPVGFRLSLAALRRVWLVSSSCSLGQ